MSSTPFHLEQPRSSVPDVGVRGDGTTRSAGSTRARIDWPELSLPPINLYNVQRLSGYSNQDTDFLRD